MNIRESIKKYSDELRESSTKEYIFLHKEKNCIISLSSTGSDFEYADGFEAEILKASSFNCLLICQPHYTSRLASLHEDIPAVLDDTAMIAGLKAPYLEKNTKEIIKALRKSSAVILSDGLAYCFGMNAYEAYTCMTILEKNSEIICKAEVLGGAIPVRQHAGALDHSSYINSYSKLERSDDNE